MAEKVIQLAPMLGLIDAPFMNAIAEVGGFDEIFAPYMLADERSIPKPQVFARRFSGISNRVNLVPQLLSNNADAFVAMANILNDLGYTKVNWNMGCPIKFVVSRNRGAALLRDLENLERLLDSVIGRLKPELSVKIRIGFGSPDEFPKIISVFNKFKLNELIVHARTAEQQYGGEPYRQVFIESAVNSLNPIVYNGDINSATDANISLPNLKGYMIGRGAIVNPHIGLQIKGLPTDNVPTFRQFATEITHWYCARNSLNRLKELWKYFAKALDKPDEIQAKLCPITNAEQFTVAVDEIFET
ncbi:MAG: tRNA-dihydrouridine synthase family protein [Salinivirgaceae bacterium]|nr:tRNA-dihydrouridine synthase family protein [Salinivirgaceae bacterium]